MWRRSLVRLMNRVQEATMAIAQLSLSEGQLRANFALKCFEWVRRAEEQKTRAKEMFASASKMRDRARQMTKPPHHVVLP